MTRHKQYSDYNKTSLTYLDEIPAHWDVMQLCRAVSCNDDVVSEASISEETIRYVDISSVSFMQGITQATEMRFTEAPSRARRKAKTGDVVVSTVRTYLKAVAQVTSEYQDCVYSTGFAVLRARPSVLHSDYLKWMALNELLVQSIEAHSEGLSYPAINASSLIKLKAPVPPIHEQIQIAGYLEQKTTRIDILIAKKTHFIELLKEKRQAVITKAVTKGLDASVRMKNSGVDWIGAVPEQWHISKLGWVIERSNAGEVIDKSYWNSGNEVLYTCAREPMSSCYAKFPLGKRTTNKDLLLTRNGTPYVHEPIANAIYSNVVQRIELKGSVHRRYLKYALSKSSEYLIGYGVSIESLNFGMWSNLNFCLPGLNEQELIAAYLDRETTRIDVLLKKTEHSIELLKEHRAALITAAVTGKIDVQEAA